ncbi:MAG: GNAT family N-acetyltransferase [Acidobacteriota bacterium]
MKITNSTMDDIDLILGFYDDAIAYQKKVFGQHWLGFERRQVEREIAEHRQFKIVVNEQIACTFVVTFNDPLIWGERDQDPAIYLHRIITHSAFRGAGFVKHIVEWAKAYARQNHKQFVRLDTWANNQKLIDYYIAHGFTYLGDIYPEKVNELPKHYEGVALALFEMNIE